MIFEQIAAGGCRSYLIGCGETCAAAVIDPEVSQVDRYLALASHHGLRIRYKNRDRTTLELEIRQNPRLQKRDRGEFVDMMRNLNLSMPTHLTEALRTNLSGGKTIAQLLSEAAALVSFMSLDELKARVEAQDPELLVLDVREREAYVAGHVPGARHLPRGQLELRVNDELPDPTRRILTVCEFGRVSTLAAATLRQIGFQRAIALDGGMKAWREAGYPLASG
jgi:rhodanese-related sulfurtransferase